MYQVTRSRYGTAHGNHFIGKILPLSLICQTCHLIPEFGEETPYFISSQPSVLESYSLFYVNSFLDLHSFELLY